VGVLIIDHGKVLLEKCYGLANLKTREPITPATTFELASCTKQFTGTAILRLYEQGKLSIHDNVRTYLPELPLSDNNNVIRILDLERHTSGLREYFGYPDVQPKDPRFQSNEDYLRAFARQAKPFPPYFKPGSDSRYTNTNYLLLALIVERVAHESYGTFLKREIFDPLGMKTATVYEHPNCRPVQPALGYEKDKETGTYEESWGAPPFRHETQLTVGDGAVWASLQDLARWDEGWRLGKVLKPATVKQALVPSTYGDGKRTDYAFGWDVSVSEGEIQTMSHNGLWGGFSTFVDRDVAAERTILVLANVDSVNVDAILRLGHAIPSKADE
jgi:CubicO group peptidase (beta-lactamase class C family)